ncbi:MAG: bifunctional diaminohydroxyphosphoribosylaminopyrimidine deaminase/5-amino-6-(5-phosphoribosylamino)uracil reductase RibD [Proteobacteria bacterium]|nr:bifunctional diaminohydroxyphosphoribosylaminopyrimidine deaminase/5-amino-6-(5-phosphoribosylamino)uracil reductase RibD [Pseudomonadota bacterium]
MGAALGLAARGLGSVWPNPAVGCVLVNGGHVVGRGWTQPGGRPHAETEALRRAGAAAHGACAYVTLEPCSHHGKTAPCSSALIEAGISRAVIALEDPDRRVAGRGIEALRGAGLEVAVGTGGEEAAELNAGFLKRIEQGLPLVTLKTAATLDGKIATHTGESQWITGEGARAAAHLLRASHDAVMIGVGTALADDPELTCRLPGLEGRSPVRIVLDRRLRTPLTGKLVSSAATAPTWIVTLSSADRDRRKAYTDAGVEVITCPADSDGNLDMAAVLRALAEKGLTRVLAEGGSHVAAALLRSGLVDRMAWFRAPGVIGADGIAAVAGLGVEVLGKMPRAQRREVRRLGEDLLETFVFTT